MKNINQKKNVIASLLKASVAISMCVFFAACGGDSSSGGEPDSKENLQEESSSSSEGEFIPTYKSENDMPNCTKDRKGNLALVEDEAMLCNDGKWQDVGKSYETSDDVPKCSKENEGESAFILDEYQALVCNDGKWTEDKDVEEVVVKPEVKSSSSGKSDEKSSNSEKVEAGSSSGAKDESGSSSSSDKDETDGSSSSNEAFPESSSAKSDVKSETFKDSRDGKTYKTVQIGNQVWFAENLNYDDGNGLCPMKDDENCEKYGRLYNFEFAEEKHSSLLTLCPEGWHIPDSLDWEELISYVSANNGDEPVGVSLKASSGWYSEGETVNIEGNGSPRGSEDSTRIGATRGTDRFGFSALPAGSCWDDGDCYVGDDTRFFFSGAQGAYGGSYKLALDKDELVYSEDGVYGWISLRCLQNPVIKIDSIPLVDVVDTLVWMVENLTHDGSDLFALRDASYACPAGWRLPTYEEMRDAVMTGKFTVPKKLNGVEYFVSNTNQYGATVYCESNCSATPVASNSERHIRCVHEDDLMMATECVCAASEPDLSNSSVTWNVSGCKDGSNKISGYSWDFGSRSAGVTVSGAEATRVFDTLMYVTPLAKVNSEMKVGDEYVKISQRVMCPTVRAGYSKYAVIFKNGTDEFVELEADNAYTAVLDGGCSAGYSSPRLTCQYSSGNPATVTVGDKTFSGSGWVILGNLDSSICNEEFSISVSEDMRCSISF